MTHLPRGWTEVALGDVCEVNPKPRLVPDTDDDVAFLGMSSVHADGTTDEGELRRFGDVSKGYTQFERGDVLVAKITPCFENGKIAQAGPLTPVATGSTEFHVVRARENVDARYILHYLRQPRVRVEGERRMTGSGGQRRVPASFVATLPLPLPPLEEQRRIAAILDKADELRAKRRAANEQLDSLTQGIFHDMFGDPVTNSMKWPEGKSLGDVAAVVSGITKGRRTSAPTRAVPYLAVANVQDKQLLLDSVKDIDATEAEIERYRLHPGDVLMTEGGDPDKLGRGTVWREELPEAIHQNHIFRVRPDTTTVTPDFLAWLVGSERGKRYFLKSAKQTTGIASINATQLRAFPLLLPPLERQRDFDSLVAKVRAARERADHADDELARLAISLQSRAFRGEL